MCTVTIVPFDGGVRLVCNRDERRVRAEALPPAVRPTSSGSAIYPIDPASAGSWVGANDAGLAVALLNRTPSRLAAAPDAPVSRGVIVPAMLACSSSRGCRERRRGARLPPLRTVHGRGRRSVASRGADPWHRNTLLATDI
jgi:hypothetical protein